MTYIWQLPSWPALTWDNEALLDPLGQARHLQGRLFGQLETLGFDEEQAVELETNRRLQDQREARRSVDMREGESAGRANVGLNEAAEPGRLYV
ncbi:MAG: DUF4172 domain-containing protein [Proteobacteria bacterium]|nr:DUF4172 domain-containing protein [Pseudomonadota bacterium]